MNWHEVMQQVWALQGMVEAGHPIAGPLLLVEREADWQGGRYFVTVPEWANGRNLYGATPIEAAKKALSWSAIGR